MSLFDSYQAGYPLLACFDSGGRGGPHGTNEISSGTRTRYPEMLSSYVALLEHVQGIF